MAASRATGGDAGDRQFQRFAVEHGDDPADGANEAGAFEAGPSHGARPSQIVNGAGEDRGQDLFRSPAELHLFGGNVLAFGSRDQIEIVDVNALLLGEAQRRACRRADGIIRHGFGWAGYFHLDVGLFGAKSLDPGGQAAGRAERLHRYAIKEIFRDEKFPDIGAEFLLGFREHPGGNLFTTSKRSSTSFSLADGFMPAPHAAVRRRQSVRGTMRQCGRRECARGS